MVYRWYQDGTMPGHHCRAPLPGTTAGHHCRAQSEGSRSIWWLTLINVDQSNGNVAKLVKLVKLVNPGHVSHG